ncbi:MAG: DUF2232 domain-containing protein [Alphaproteobacteria bacterium]|nr:DUF2232 domain-containing protein [Alphaproteobacteria bacterium]
MSKAALLAIPAGAASGAFHLALLLGSPGAFVFAYLATLPLFLTGLALGWGPTALAGAVATLVVAFGTDAWPALWYATIDAIPAAILVRQALLWRAEENGAVTWYPPGLLATWICGYAGAVLLALALWFSGEPNGLEGRIENAIGPALQRLSMIMPVRIEDEATKTLIAVMPMGVSVSWAIMLGVNMALAQGLLGRFGKALRPAPRLVEYGLGPLMTLAFALGLAASFLDGTTRLVGLAVAGTTGLAYAVAGIALVHALAARTGDRRKWVLALFYIGFLLFYVWALPALMVMGLADQWLGLRRRFGGGPT